MSNILVINASGQETRVALIEQGTISEYYLERKNEKGIVGNIYKGRVVRVLPGMQAAFVDIGLDKAAFVTLGAISMEALRRTDTHFGETVVVYGVALTPTVDSCSAGVSLWLPLLLPETYTSYLPVTMHAGYGSSLASVALALSSWLAARYAVARFRRALP